MPARKTASRTRKAAGAAGKKKASRKASARKASARKTTGKKATGKKRKVSQGKSRSAAASTKKSASRKKTTRPSAGRTASRKAKTSTRKSTAKQVSRKKVTATKTSSRKAASTAGKKPVRKAATPKSASSARKKTAATQAKPAAAGAGDGRPRSDILSGPLRFKPYVPKRGEPYMSPAQLAHFEAILRSWKLELMNEVDRTVHHMQDEAANFPDPNDRATQESEFGLELRTRDRERKLLRKIDAALQRIQDGTYGYCDETGEEIGLKRLEARPVATLCLEAQERREMAERQFRDRDDRYR